MEAVFKNSIEKGTEIFLDEQNQMEKYSKPPQPSGPKAASTPSARLSSSKSKLLEADKSVGVDRKEVGKGDQKTQDQLVAD